MTLAVGTRLGPYEVLAPLGAGAMGEVHRARDSKLNRDVALKVLPREFALDPDRLARFRLEAQVLASLNHPNIGAIYGFEESNGVHALVLELVEGPTLADRIAKGPLPIPEALVVARQIADALEAAHKQGVIHRDLKPPNIKLRPDGMVKVLDFGLAKLVPASGFELRAPDLSQLPTITSPATVRGVIMGTPAYMSPEQARGTAVDKQTDIWGFGAVFFEMLSGRPVFSGATFSDTIAKILEREPDWQALPTSTPGRIRNLLGRCLQKDQRRRLHDIADARIEIEEAHTVVRGPLRQIGLPVLAAAVALAVGSMVGTWWYAYRSVPSTQHEQVSVLIADFQNQTADPTFDRSLESVLRLGLEGASFITAYDRTRVNTLGVQPPERLDEATARELAATQGLGVVLSGSIDPRGSGYTISVKAVQTITGDTITSAEGRASSKDEVPEVATRLAARLRTALGDDTSDTAQMFAMATLSATSLDVLRHYAAGRQASSTGRFDEARRSYAAALELDPSFGTGYQSLAILSMNLGNLQDAEKYFKEALRHLDSMTERERYNTRGMYYRMTGDYQQCVQEFRDLIARYAGDVLAHNNLALCLTFLRNMPDALDEMRRTVEILPKRALYRINLALYASYAGDFQTGEREARTAFDLQSPLSYVPLAFSQLGQGQLSQAAQTYEELAKADGLGTMAASHAASGLGDLAVFEGRFSDAVQIFAQGAAADLKTQNPDRAAAKFAALANTELSRREPHAAVAAAEKALANSKVAKIRFLVARAFIDAAEIARARPLIVGLAAELQAEPQAYATILEAQIALNAKDPRRAVKLLIEANGLLDTWIGHFDLGRAYFEVGAFAQADSEFDRCLKRRGEALSLFLDEEPTYGYFAPVYYYQGRVREELKNIGFADSYRTYLRIREEAGEDPLLAEVRRRSGL